MHQRLDDAIEVIEREMQRSPKAGFQAFSRWYKRREGVSLPLSVERIAEVEHEYNALYSNETPAAPMFALDMIPPSEVPDGPPDNGEIARAVAKAPRGKACGPSGVKIDTLKEWLHHQQERETQQPKSDYDNWRMFCELVRSCFDNRSVPQAFRLATLVLVPKADTGKYWGIALLESAYKVLTSIIAHRINEHVEFHEALHGFRRQRGCETAILEAKIKMQLARKEGKTYHQVFLDLSKAYDTVDQNRLLTIMRQYGLGPNTCGVLQSAWGDSQLAPRTAKVYGGVIRRKRGVQQGDPLSPTLFNLVVDAIVRNVESEMGTLGLAGETDTLFYADDGTIGGYQPAAIQTQLDLYTDRFAAMGLKMNAQKTVSMTSAPKVRPTRLSFGARKARAQTTGARYEVRSREPTQCLICARVMQKRNLLRHHQQQHPERPKIAPPPLYSPSPQLLGRQQRSQWIDMPNGTEIFCPMTQCPEVRLRTRTDLFNHWARLHGDTPLVVAQCPNYQKCPRCDKYLKSVTDRHFSTRFCREGVRRKHRRVLEELSTAAPFTFTVRGTALQAVTKFRYLGRILSNDDSDLAACQRNITKARAKWAAISKVLRRDGASIKVSARFYQVVATTVLLYGSSTWAMTHYMMTLLSAFHNQCAQQITKEYIRKDPDLDEWITPDSARILRKAHLLPIADYIALRRTGLIKRYGENQKLDEWRQMQGSATYGFNAFWDQGMAFQLQVLGDPEV